MKNKLLKTLLPTIGLTSILPVACLTGCNKEDNHFKMVSSKTEYIVIDNDPVFRAQIDFNFDIADVIQEGSLKPSVVINANKIGLSLRRGDIGGTNYRFFSVISITTARIDFLWTFDLDNNTSIITQSLESKA